MKPGNDEGSAVRTQTPQEQTKADPAIVADTPRRVQMSRRKGARIPPGTVKVARKSKWGNEFKVEDYGRERAIELYRGWLFGKMAAGELDVRELRGKHLWCTCKLTEACHADLLLALANAAEGKP